jgi:hypothetical protein
MTVFRQNARAPMRAMALLLTASSLLAPGVAMARAASALTAREAALMERLERLEAEVRQLRADAAASRQQQGEAVAAAVTQASAATQIAQSAATQAKATSERVAVVEKKPEPEGMRVGSSHIRIGGFIKFNADYSHFDGGTVATNTLGRDFYLPQAIPVVTPTSRGSTDTDFSAKQTRLWFNLDTTVAGHTLRGYLETDFQTTASAAANVAGGAASAPPMAIRWRCAGLCPIRQMDLWTGVDDVPECRGPARSTDFVGATEGTVFARQPQVRYSTPLSRAATLHIAVENPESATATAGSAALVENGSDHLPDFIARLNARGAASSLSPHWAVRCGPKCRVRA